MSDLSEKTVFVVLRAARGTPPGFMPPGMEGRWEYRPERTEQVRDMPPAAAVALPTGRIEHRESDGASAEVWEVHPIGGNYDPDEWGLPL